MSIQINVFLLIAMIVVMLLFIIISLFMTNIACKLSKAVAIRALEKGIHPSLFVPLQGANKFVVSLFQRSTHKRVMSDVTVQGGEK